MIRRAEDSLISECGMDYYKQKQIGIIYHYHLGMFWVIIHCAVLYKWLIVETPNHFMFWAVYFGIPHILNPILLTMHVSHIIHMFVARLEYFRNSIASNAYDDIDHFWDTFRNARRSAMKLNEELQPILSMFTFLLFFAIVMQSITVFSIFKSHFYSVIYMISNAVMLFWVMFQAQRVNYAFETILWEINYLPINSVLGDFKSSDRQYFQKFTSTKDILPSLSLKIFGFVTVSIDFFYKMMPIVVTSLTTAIFSHLTPPTTGKPPRNPFW